MALSILALLVLSVLSYLLYTFVRPRPTPRKPPGPKSFPLLGNISDFPPPGIPEHTHWSTHLPQYGAISSVSILGTTMILLNTKDTAHALLTKQSSITSGRPSMTMANTLCGYERIVLCQGYTASFKRCRRFLHGILGSRDAVRDFENVMEVETGRMLVRALERPEGWVGYLTTASSGTILKMAYGYTIEPYSPDPLVTLIDRMMTEFSLASVPMAWAVDIVRILRYLPEWFPGAGFQKTARKWRKSIEDTAYIPYRFVQRQMKQGVYQESFVSKLITQLSEENCGVLDPEDEQAIIWTAASLYGAAADTTVIALTAFTAAMIMYPDVEKAAQEEIDRVVGVDRLPYFQDRENLPYINALVKEILRWWPIAPMGFPHTATEDITYKSMHIPKDSIFLPAVWSILHDPNTYANPEKFDPARFLPPRNEPDPESEAWGYGRRICAGRYFADASLYLNVVQGLAAFRFGKGVNKEGREVEVNIKAKPGVLAYPTEFEYHVQVRSERHRELIRGVGEMYPFEESDAGLLVVDRECDGVASEA